METLTHCTLCPRRCGADRTRTHGLCGGGGMVKIARAALHFWEEPASPAHRAAARCSFRAARCNAATARITHQRRNSGGRYPPALADIFLELQEQGAHNINLVTAGHYLLGMRGTRYGPARAAYPGGIQYRRL